MQHDDVQLVVRCLDGDADAFGELVLRYQGAVYATAYYYVGRYGVAEDISQESFLAAYRSLPWLKEHAKFGPWLKGVTCRVAANWLRKNAARLKNETPLPHRQTISIEDARRGPQGVMEANERYERVQMAIDSLPERYRLPVVLRYLQEMSYKEIGDFIGIPYDEVRGILQRAGRQLADALAGMESRSGEAQWRPAAK